MKPIKTDESNVNLTLPGAADLPATRCRFHDPGDGEESNGFETVWIADEDERERLASGAPVILRVWGNGHPPVSLVIPEIPAHRKAVDRDHASRALGALLAALKEKAETSLALLQPATEGQPKVTIGDVLPAPVDFLALWESSLDLTAQRGEIDEAIEKTLKEALDLAKGETEKADEDGREAGE